MQFDRAEMGDRGDETSEKALSPFSHDCTIPSLSSSVFSDWDIEKKTHTRAGHIFLEI